MYYTNHRSFGHFPLVQNVLPVPTWRKHWRTEEEGPQQGEGTEDKKLRWSQEELTKDGTVLSHGDCGDVKVDAYAAGSS